MSFLKKFFATLLVVIFIFLALYLGVVYYLGDKTEQSINDEIAILSKSNILQVDSYQYKRGFFTSSAQAKVSIRPNVLKTIGVSNFPEVLRKVFENPVILRTKVKHGPFVKSFLLRAYATTDVIFDPQAEQEIVKFFGTKNPFQIENLIYPMGAGVLNFNLNSMNYKELSGIEINFDGSKGQLEYQSDYDQYSIKINLPKFNMLLADRGHIILTGLMYNSTNIPNPGSIDLGNVHLEFNRLSVSAQLEDKMKFNLSDLIGILANVEIGDLFDPELSFSTTNAVVEKFKFDTIFNKNNDLLNLTANLLIDNIIINQEIYGPFILKVNANHLHGESLKILKDSINELSSQTLTPERWQEEVLTIIRGPAVGLFTFNPEFELKQLYFKLPNGELKVTGLISFEGLKSEDLYEFSTIANKARAILDYALPEELLIDIVENQLVGLFISGHEETNEEDLKNILETVKYLVKNMINNYAALRYINLVNGIISGSVKLERGKIYLNGIELKTDETNIDDIYEDSDDQNLNKDNVN